MTAICDNVRRSSAVLLLSSLVPNPCGQTAAPGGFKSCREMKEAMAEGSDFAGPVCSWRILDLGIAPGSAVKTASLQRRQPDHVPHRSSRP